MFTRLRPQSRSFVPQTLLLLRYIVNEQVAYLASFYAAPVTRHGTFSGPFTFTVLEFARVPTDALFEVTQARAPHVLDVGAIGDATRSFVAEFIVVDVVGRGREPLESWQVGRCRYA